MKIETLKVKIQKTTEKLEKSNGTLKRHNAQLIKKSKALTDRGIDLNSYDKFDRNIIDHETYWDLCDYEGKLEDIKNTEKKITETAATLEKLQEQLKNQLTKESETENIIPEVLNIFLKNWKQKCYDFYITLANEYITLISKGYTEYEITREELEKLKKKKYNKNYTYELVNRYTEEETEKILSDNIMEYEKQEIKHSIKNRHIKEYRERHFASDMAILDRIISYNTISEITLNKILDDDVKLKKEMFINRIKEVIGEIKDLTGLRIGDNGEINGIAKGVKCNAKVETITAGGYNIQCWHYRVLVNTVK